MKNYKLLTRLLVLIFLATVSPVAAGTGLIQGKVIEDSTETPIENLWVVLYDSSHNYIKRIKTNSEGEYRLENIQFGTYKVRFLTQNTVYIEQWYNGKTNIADASLITVNNTNPVNLEISRLLQGGSISGEVTDGSNGIGNIIVYIYHNGIWVRSATTDGTGKYKVTGLSTGDYTVLFGAYNTPYVSTWYNGKEEDFADIVPVTAPNDTPGINAVLSIGGTISGTVRNQYGLVKDAWIDVYDNDTNWRGYASTTDGTYTVKGLPDIEFKVQFFERNYKNKGAGKQLWYNQTKNVAEATPVAVNSTGIDALFEPSKASKLLPAYQQLLLTP